MSQTIEQAFIRQYEKDVHKAYQRGGSKLANTVRRKNNVEGESTTFQKVGKGSAVQKSRHGEIKPMNIEHSNVRCLLEDWYAGDWIDKLDELKTNIDERDVIISSGASALGRTTDEMIFDQLGLTTLEVGDYSTGITLSLLSQSLEQLNNNDVPDDGMRFGVLAPHAWEEFLNIPEVSSADFVDDKPWTQGNQVKRWRNAYWMQHTGCPLDNTNERDCFLYHKTSVGLATGCDVKSDFDWVGTRAAWFANNMMSKGSILIDTLGAVKIKVHNALPIS